MSKITLLFVVLFVVAMVLPELRSVMVVGGVGVMIGFIVGTQHKATADIELRHARSERVSMRTIEA